MGALSFSKNRCDILPEEIDGCEIDADFRVVLQAIRIFNSRDYELYDDALYYFYVDARPEDAYNKMIAFILGGEEPEPSGDPPRMDFEFDADEIYADFLNFYGIDLLTAHMHWYKFRALLGGILAREGALASKIQTRFAKLDGLKGKERMEAERAKERVQLPVQLTAQEAEEAARFADEWGGL